MAAPPCGRNVLSTIDADPKREPWPRERADLAWLDALMDQLHRSARQPPPGEHSGPNQEPRGAPGGQINAMKNTIDAVVDKGQWAFLGGRTIRANRKADGVGPSILQSKKETRKETA